MTRIIVALILAFLLVSMCSGQYVPPLPQKYIKVHSDNFGAIYPQYPIKNVWHCGDDVPAPYDTEVLFPVSGQIIGGSPGGWDSDAGHRNYALRVKYLSLTGLTYEVILGHLQRPKKNGLPISDAEVRVYRTGESVSAGEFAGNIGHWATCDHLHIGVVCYSSGPPSDKLGMQPLPQPEMTMISGVRTYGAWSDPIPRLQRLTGVTCGTFESFLPKTDLFGRWLYFVKKPYTSNDEVLTIADMEGTKTATVWQLPSGWKVDDYVVLKDDIVVKTHSAIGDFRLSRISKGEESFLMSSAYNFVLARGERQGKGEFIVVFLDEKEPTMIVDVGDWKYRKLCDFLYGPKTPFDFLTKSPEEKSDHWRLIGSRNDPETSQTRIFVVTGDSAGEHRGWVKTEGECRNAVLTSDHQELTIDALESVAFNHTSGGSSVVASGTLTPIAGDMFHNGYSLTEYRDLKLATGEPVEVDWYVPQTGQLLVTVGINGCRHVGSCDVNGSNLQTIIK